MFKKVDKQTLFNVVLLFLLLFLLFDTQLNTPTKKIVFVKNSQLFNEFLMTKELQKTAEKEYHVQKSKVDSISLQLQGENLPVAQREQLAQQLISIRENFEMAQQNFAQEHTLKIQSRLNGYVQEFSKERNYLMVLGTENNNAVLFGDEAKDVTKEVINYVNRKYEGLQ